MYKHDDCVLKASPLFHFKLDRDEKFWGQKSLRNARKTLCDDVIMVHPGSSPGSHVESWHRRGRRCVWKQRRINRISRKFRYVHPCYFIRMMQRTHRLRWMYFEVVSQSVSPMNWFAKSWMSSRSFPPACAVISHAMETSSYPQEFAVLGLLMLMRQNELR